MKIEKAYQPDQFEDKIYADWESSGYFKAKIEGSEEGVVIPQNGIENEQSVLFQKGTNDASDAINEFVFNKMPSRWRL